MSDAIKSLVGTARVQTILVSWFMPLLLPSFVFALFVAPKISESAFMQEVRDATSLLGLNNTLLVLILCFAASVFMHANREFLYRSLEGITWPPVLQRWRVDRAHRPQYRVLVVERQIAEANAGLEAASAELAGAPSPDRRRQLEADVGAYRAEIGAAEEPLRKAKGARAKRGRTKGWLSRVPRRSRPLLTFRSRGPRDTDWSRFPYPEKPEHLMPTQVGNALRRIETYGAVTFGLDSQILWYELFSSVPDALRVDYADGELQTDSFVALIYGSWGLGLSAGVSAAWAAGRGDSIGQLVVVAVASLLASVLLQRGLLRSISLWGESLRAIVNIGRPALWAANGLPQPRTVEEARDMAATLTGLAYYPSEQSFLDKLLRFQARSDGGKQAAEPNMTSSSGGEQ